MAASSEGSTVAAANAPMAPQPAAAPTMSAAEWTMLLVLSVVWGASFFFMKVALAEVTPLTVVAARVGLGAALLWGLILARGLPVPSGLRRWRDYAILGLVGNLAPFGLIAFGQAALPSGLAAILNASTPLWTVLLAHLATPDERLTAQRLTGVLVGMAGVAVIVGPQAFTGGPAAVLPSLAIVGAALCYAAAAIFARRYRGEPPIVTSAAQLGVSALIAVPLLLAVDGAPLGLSMQAYGSLAFVGLVATGLAFLLFFRILSGAGATNAVLVTFLVPVSAILLGALFLSERLEPREFAGMACIALGLAAIDGRPLRRLRTWRAR